MKTFVAVIASCVALSAPVYSYTDTAHDTKLDAQTMQLLMAKECESSKNTATLAEPTENSKVMLACGSENK